MLSLHCCHCCRRCNRRHIVCICIDDVVVTNNANDCVCSDNELGCLLLFLFFCLLLLAVVELTTTSLQHCVIIAVVALHVFAMMMWLSQTMQRIALTVSMSLVVCSAIFLVVFLWQRTHLHRGNANIALVGNMHIALVKKSDM